jgi:Transglycosylase SLT domain
MPTDAELLGMLPSAAAPTQGPSDAELLGMTPAAQPRYQQTLSQSPEVWRQRLNFDAREDRQGLPRGTMTRLVRLESGGDPTAVSGAGAQGLWQLMPGTAAVYKVDPFNPEQATDAAERELGNLYRKYNGSVPHMIAAWNWGQGNLDRHGLEKAPRETRNLIANMGADVPADMRAQGVQFARPSTGLPVTRIAATQGTTIPSLAAPSPTIPGSFLLEQLRQLEPGAAVKPPLLEEKWPDIQPLQPVNRERLMEYAFPGSKLQLGPEERWFGKGTGAELAQQPQEVERPGYLGLAKTIPSMAIQGGTTVLGASLGAPLGPAGMLAGGIGGSYYGHQLSKELGLTPGEPTLLPRDLGDYLALATPAVPAALEGAGKVASYMVPGVRRAQKAITAAEEQTGRLATEAETRAATKTQEDLRKAQEEFGAREAEAQARAAEVTRQEAEQFRTKQAEYEAEIQRRQLAQSEQEQTATVRAEAKTAQDAEAYRRALAAIDENLAAAQKVSQLPGRYLPEVPGRTPNDIRRDVNFLREGDAAARKTVVDRLGVEDEFAAMAKLREEADVVLGTGARTTPLPGEPVPPATKPTTFPVTDQGPELRQFILSPSQGKRGLRLAGETDVPQDAARYIEPGAVGRQQSLLNNRSGWTLDEMAQRAQEAGYLRTADKGELLDALRESQGGRPVYSMRRTVEAPTEPAYLPPTAQPSRQTNLHRASGVSYDRFEEIAPSAPATMVAAKMAAEDVVSELGAGFQSLPPGGFKKVAEELLAMGNEGNLSQVHSLIKQLRRASATTTDGNQRYLIGRLTDGLMETAEQSALESSVAAEALPHLKLARQAYRQEMGVDQLNTLVKASLHIDSQTGQTYLDVNLPDKFKRLYENSKHGQYFRESFPPETFEALQQELMVSRYPEGFIGVPPYPTRTPAHPIDLPGRSGFARLKPPEEQRVIYGNKVDVPVSQRPYVVEPLEAVEPPQPTPPRRVEYLNPSELPQGDPRRQFAVRPFEAPEATTVTFGDPNLQLPGQRQFNVEPVDPQAQVKRFFTRNPVMTTTSGGLVGGAAIPAITSGNFVPLGIAATAFGLDELSQLIARALTSPKYREPFTQLMRQSRGAMTPEMYGILGMVSSELGREEETKR